MAVKPGYKLTEVGVIPEDWEVLPLAATVDFLDGQRRPVKDNDRAKVRGDIPYYGASGIVDYVNNFIFDDTLILLGEDGENIISRNCRLAFIISGKAWVNNHAHVLKPRHGYDIGFLAEYLESLEYEQYNTGTAQPKLNKQVCSKIPVLRPPLPEQTAIATTLSDVDALISSLDALISKKKQIKQGTMQELLSGKRRLPGFSGEWEARLLNEISWFQEGPGVRNTQFTSSGIKLLNGSNIILGELKLDNTNRFISEKEAYSAYSHFMADSDDIVIASSGISIDRFHEKVARVKKTDLPLCMNTSTIRFKVNSKYTTAAFLFQLLVSDQFKRAIGGQATGSAQLNFGPSHLTKVAVNIPPLPEQQAIAAILSDMDTEITTLESRKNKTKLLKQGMMQELLTGRIRLPIEHSTVSVKTKPTVGMLQ